MATLNINDLSKNDYWKVFLDKIKNGHSFLEDSTKKEFKIKLNKKTVDRMKKMSIQEGLEPFKKGNSYFFPTDKNTELRLTRIYKSADLGGVGSTIHKENIQLDSLNKQIKDYLAKNRTDYVPVKVESKTYKVIMAESTHGTPKSDFHLVDIDGKPCVWISHKDGTSPKSFQQYGGFTEKGMYDTEKEIQQFVEAIRNVYDVFPPSTTIGSMIKSRQIKGKSIYGIDFGKARGINNVNLVLQGNVKIERGTLVGSSHTWNNGYIPTGDYEPIMIVRHANRKQFNIQKSRFMISPKGGRRVNEMLKL